MKTFSNKWISSKKPGKQRKYRANAPLHIRRKMMAATLSDELRKSYHKRSMPVRKDDMIMIMRGTHRGQKGKITEVNMKLMKIKVDGIKVKKANKEAVPVYIDPSKVMITTIFMDDIKRKNFSKRKGDNK